MASVWITDLLLENKEKALLWFLFLKKVLSKLLQDVLLTAYKRFWYHYEALLHRFRHLKLYLGPDKLELQIDVTLGKSHCSNIRCSCTSGLNPKHLWICKPITPLLIQKYVLLLDGEILNCRKQGNDASNEYFFYITLFSLSLNTLLVPLYSCTINYY